MNKTRFSVPKMDCGAEEQLVRVALVGQPEVHRLDTYLNTREVVVLHEGQADKLVALLEALNLGATFVETTIASELEHVPVPTSKRDQVRTLAAVLGINAVMFAAELTAAFWADSSALLADSLDMFADATVYAIALFAVHQTHTGQLRAARLSGVLQLFLAFGAFGEIARRAVFGSDPEASIMILVAIVALVANGACMWLLARHRTGGAHMKASWIFTTNDVIENLLTIAAAVLVYVLQSALPDLVVGTVIALVVLSGAVRILRLRSGE